MSDNQKGIMYSPEAGTGVLPPINIFEKYLNALIEKLPYLGAIVTSVIVLLISIDVIGRTFFNFPLEGLLDLESLALIFIGFSGMAYSVITRESIQVDMFYRMFSTPTQCRLNFFAMLLCTGVAFILAYSSLKISFDWVKTTEILRISECYFLGATGLFFLFSAIAFTFQIIHTARKMLYSKDYIGIIVILLTVLFLCAVPFLYKYFGVKWSSLLLGGIGFLVLMFLLLIRIPIGWAMAIMGILGLFLFIKRPSAVLANLGSVPFLQTSSFIYLAIPMFLLMGEIAFFSGLSNNLFDAANKWFGRLPGGLAVATIGGCAGFGAICGDSLGAVLTMTAVALEPMQKNGYADHLATGCIAAGGTLGILIPPSMGFIFYSTLTEVSVGKLFVAGIFPGLLLTFIFMLVVIVIVKRHPEYAPQSLGFTLREKLMSLIGLIPIILLFAIVVGGILYGYFTPGEGGAVGAMVALLYGVYKKNINYAILKKILYKSSVLFGKIFILFVGISVFGSFLTISHLPTTLAEFIIEMDVNKYIILLAVILLFIILGCVMNIMAMMVLTLPTIYPTIAALGFDGVWFGVILVIIMEMGMITPPVGLNVFTLSSLVPEIPMATIFRGVIPFFLGMLLCVLLILIFPPIALYLPSLM